MPLTPGTRLGCFEISAPVGKGGMGEVYRALDTKLGRHVAIKILPDDVAHDPSRLARFEREAKALAALNHPHIAQIYGLEHADGMPALVMELVEGPTLSDHIARGPMPLAEALRIACQIAEAIEAAHAQGIVHRDLKPANVKLTSSGSVKVLDFGLAIMSPQGRAPMPDVMLTSETVTRPGIVIGTPAYMAPEQARAETAGHSADIWAFGCVLFTLLSGSPPFRGETATDLLAAVLKEEPAWNALPEETPASVRRILRRCLEKDVRSRFHHIADVRIAIEDAAEGAAPVRVRRVGVRERAAWTLAALALAGATAAFVRWPESSAERRVDIVTPPEADAGGIALSPDGSRIAYTALAKGVPYLYVRSLENGSVRTIAGSDGAALPFWSPDGHSVAFFAESKLKRVTLDTNAIQPIADATLSPAGGSWSRHGWIVFAPNIRGRILQVHESGGEVKQVLAIGRSPRFLADGRRFLFLDGGVYVGAVDSSQATLLSNELAMLALPDPPGYITFLKKGGGRQLFVRRFDEDRLTLSGAETVIAERVHVSTDGISASATVSETGVLAFRETSTVDVQPRRLGEFDRAGMEVRRIGELGGLSPAASPAFDYIALSRATTGNALYLLETARGILTPFTSGPADQTAIWSPDGRNIVFSSARRGAVEMFIKPVDGGDEKPLLDPPPDMNSRVATDWAGDFLLFRSNSAKTNYDIYALPMRGTERQPISIVRTESSERDAQFSPDMKWIAYESNKSGQSEIYMTRFPSGGREFQISPQGGAQVRWNPANRRELFYVALDGRLMSMTVEFSADNATATPRDPVALFQTRIGTVVQGAQKQQYVVTRDGQRFIVSNVIEDALSPITLIVNWKPPAN